MKQPKYQPLLTTDAITFPYNSFHCYISLYILNHILNKDRTWIYIPKYNGNIIFYKEKTIFNMLLYNSALPLCHKRRKQTYFQHYNPKSYIGRDFVHKATRNTKCSLHYCTSKMTTFQAIHLYMF